MMSPFIIIQYRLSKVKQKNKIFGVCERLEKTVRILCFQVNRNCICTLLDIGKMV